MNRVEGFRFGLRQPTLRLGLHFFLPNNLSFPTIDQWIVEALEADIEDYHPIADPEINEQASVVQYLRRLLFVTTLLLQDLRVPVFERAAIKTLRQGEDGEGGVQALVWFPMVSHLDHGVLQECIRGASSLLAALCRGFGSSDTRERAYQYFQKNHVDSWLKRVPGGKSTIPILEAAFELGIPFHHQGQGIYVLGWGSRSCLFDRSSNAYDSAIGSSATNHKGIAIRLMREAGIPVPRGVQLASNQPDDCVLDRLTLPLVVKPVDRDRGEGVTMGVRDIGMLGSAFALAASFSDAVLVEEQVPGVCHRILVVEDQIVFVVKRNPRSVIGDGHRTVRALVEEANRLIRQKLPQKRLPEYVIDDLAISTLAQHGLRLDSVPMLGQKAPLRPAQSTQWGGDPVTVTNDLHEDNAEIAIRAARLFGLRCAGVDFISQDISIPWHQNGAVINEVNYAPVMGRTHAYQRQGVRDYLKIIFPDWGKIPIDIFFGLELADQAMERCKTINASGRRAFLCTEECVRDEQGQLVHGAAHFDLYDRVAMLRSNHQVDALVVHLETPEFLSDRGLPFEYISRLVVAPFTFLNDQQRQAIASFAEYLEAGREVEHVAAY